MGSKPRRQPNSSPAIDDDPDLAGPPLAWAESIHGYLMLFPRRRGQQWTGYERGTTPSSAIIADGLLAALDEDQGLVFLAGRAARFITGDDGSIIVVVDRTGYGDDGLVDTVARVTFEDTGIRLRSQGEGFVLFDGAASWQMVSGGLYVQVAAPEPVYAVRWATTERALALQLIST